MTKPRVKETDQGIQGEVTVANYDQMLRGMRDRGWIETDQIIKAGITHGHALEIGPGPGYLGLEWLKKTRDTTLTGLDISPDMVALSGHNAIEYSLSGRAEYVLSSGSKISYEDGSFDAVFTNGSMHEWSDPCSTFNEMWRVLKPGGRVFISDLRRDMSLFLQWFLWLSTQPTAIRPGLLTSIRAAYTPQELRELILKTDLAPCNVTGNAIGLILTGIK
jgi:ubiquinone/menaquinone biosynthesis C-methylase UbiE